MGVCISLLPSFVLLEHLVLFFWLNPLLFGASSSGFSLPSGEGERRGVGGKGASIPMLCVNE